MLTIGLILITLMASVLTVDTGWYFAAQNQLQTAADAAALAGGAHMFEGQDAAEEAALEVGEANEIAGMALTAENFEFDASSGSFTVKAQAQVPTLIAKMVCAMSASDDEGESCDYMTVYAGARAVGAPRDTVLVIDTSSSMDDLGGGQPYRDVQDAAYAFLDRVVEMEEEHPNSVDRVAIVKFDHSSSLVHNFVSTQDSPGLNVLKDEVDDMDLYTGSGFSTNYESGLRVALDTLSANARPGAHKTIIFFTDGEPNLPSGSNNINTCLFQKYMGKHSQAKTCTKNYVNYMLNQTNAQITRARNMNVTIHTIQISDPEGGSSLETFRWLLQDSDWEPGMVDAMATETEGKQFEAESADGDAIMEVFQSAAKIVKIKLAPFSDN